MDYANGESYDGQWENDLKHGFGIMKYADGTTYYGYW